MKWETGQGDKKSCPPNMGAGSTHTPNDLVSYLFYSHMNNAITISHSVEVRHILAELAFIVPLYNHALPFTNIFHQPIVHNNRYLSTQ